MDVKNVSYISEKYLIWVFEQWKFTLITTGIASLETSPLFIERWGITAADKYNLWLLKTYIRWTLILPWGG